MREQDLEILKDRLQMIKEMGWIKNRRPGNNGGVGNTLEDLLEVEENNLQLPDFGAWELKSQRSRTSSLLTLFHSEPFPRRSKIVPQILLPLYGWPHQKAGITYPADERSFRQTINVTSTSDRGFSVCIDEKQERFLVSFRYDRIADRHAEWRDFILHGVGTGELDPKPYWTFAVISKKLQTKLKNLMYVRADTKKIDGEEYYRYREIEAYVDPSLERFIELMKQGFIYVDFDARTGHNHGTKIRIRPSYKESLYERHIKV
ncbi:MAG: MvaI/BcnI restriction endonuclease family protein [Ruminococcus sp.]|nr:MvaI/BcnI restriction endonuclease family protein [Ruminococcus sp.]